MFSELNDRDVNKVTWLSDNHSEPNGVIPCQGCKGIEFNSEEILEKKRTGKPATTPCSFCGISRQSLGSSSKTGSFPRKWVGKRTWFMVKKK